MKTTNKTTLYVSPEAAQQAGQITGEQNTALENFEQNVRNDIEQPISHFANRLEGLRREFKGIMQDHAGVPLEVVRVAQVEEMEPPTPQDRTGPGTTR